MWVIVNNRNMNIEGGTPPFGSIFYAHKCGNPKKKVKDDPNFSDYTEYMDCFGFNADRTKDVRINYNGREVVLLSYDYKELEDEVLNELLNEPGLYEFIQNEQPVKETIFDSDQKFVYDAALLDGCNEEQAIQVAMGSELNQWSTYGYYNITIF